MKKNLFLITSLLAILALAACNSEEPVEDTENKDPEPTEEITPEENEAEVEEQDEASDAEESEGSNSNDVVAEAMEEFPDAVRLGEEIEYESEDSASQDHINQKINHFYFADEIDGVEPSNDFFLVVNITIDNLIDDYFYGVNFLSSVARDDKRTTYQRETGELEEELTDEGDGVSTGNIIYDVKEAKYYRISMHGDKEFILFPDEAEEAPEE
ncbi:hypothetical protein GI584_08710 [Gracilibacillus salitolerans]|uniref:DUF4352 domain-containing protein n=1 Tax=Gracilibacillus salitolerans TaxID=2663022 RepID=A0A5Q2THE7_9BACI|nr:hypothetical protein [Gracilibacillus salitolerans]QGH34095.1 hypothetical protein GI584_08710 [Gracilibacillus salitolerans]